MLVLALLTLNAFASDPCSKAKITTDKATQETHLRFGGGEWEVNHGVDGTTYSARMFRSGVTSSTLQQGWPLRVELDDGSAMRLRLAEPAKAKSHTDETGSFTQWQTVFTVTPDSVQKLASNPMASVSSDLGQGVTSTPVAKGRGKKLLAAFQCIATQM